MPEIWLNYGSTNTILDIKAENLEQEIKVESNILDDSTIKEKLDSLDISKPFEIAVLNNTSMTHKIINTIFTKCEEKSVPIPKVFTNRNEVVMLKNSLPEGSLVLEFTNSDEIQSNLVFVAETELDGLLGFETVSSRLVKKYGKDIMKEIFNKRSNNRPTPGKINSSAHTIKKFMDEFEISSIEITSTDKGIVGIHVGHPSSMDILPNYAKIITKKIDPTQIIISSTGKYSSNDTLDRSLQTIWNCSGAVQDDGLLILTGESGRGLGSLALQQFVEKRLDINDLKRTEGYIDGLENLFYLQEEQKRIKIGLISILPELYTKSLEIIPFDGIRYATEHILSNYGQNRKISVISDGARILL